MLYSSILKKKKRQELRTNLLHFFMIFNISGSWYQAAAENGGKSGRKNKARPCMYVERTSASARLIELDKHGGEGANTGN